MNPESFGLKYLMKSEDGVSLYCSQIRFFSSLVRSLTPTTTSSYLQTLQQGRLGTSWTLHIVRNYPTNNLVCANCCLLPSGTCNSATKQLTQDKSIAYQCTVLSRFPLHVNHILRRCTDSVVHAANFLFV
jgi:hypothetical protein